MADQYIKLNASVNLTAVKEQVTMLQQALNSLGEQWKKAFDLEALQKGDRTVTAYQERINKVKELAEAVQDANQKVTASIKEALTNAKEPINTLGKALTKIADAGKFMQTAMDFTGRLTEKINRLTQAFTDMQSKVEELKGVRLFNYNPGLKNFADQMVRLKNVGPNLQAMATGLKALNDAEGRKSVQTKDATRLESAFDRLQARLAKFTTDQGFQAALDQTDATLTSLGAKFTDFTGKVSPAATSVNTLKEAITKLSPVLVTLANEFDKVSAPSDTFEKRLKALEERLTGQQSLYGKAISEIKQHTDEIIKAAVKEVELADAKKQNTDATDAEATAQEKLNQALKEQIDKPKEFNFGELANNLNELQTQFSAIMPYINEAVTALYDFSKECINVASNVEQTGVRLSVMSQSGVSDINEIRDVIANVSKQTGLSFNELEKGAETLSRAGANVKEYLLSAATLAVATGKSIETASYNFGRATQGDARALLSLQKQFGITNQELRMYGVAMNENGQVSKQAAQDAMKLKDSIKDLVDTKYGSALNKYTQTLQGQLDATNASIERLQANIGANALPSIEFLTRGIARLSVTLSDNGTMIGSVGAGIGTLIALITKAAVAIGGLVIVLGTISNKWKTITDAVSACLVGFRSMNTTIIDLTIGTRVFTTTIGSLALTLSLVTTGIAAVVIAYQSWAAETEHQIQLQNDMQNETKHTIDVLKEEQEILSTFLSGGKSLALRAGKSARPWDIIKEQLGLNGEIPDTAEELAPLMKPLENLDLDMVLAAEKERLKQQLDIRNAQTIEIIKQKQQELYERYQKSTSWSEQQQLGAEYAGWMQALKKNPADIHLVETEGLDKEIELTKKHISEIEKLSSARHRLGGEATKILQDEEKEREKADKLNEKRKKDRLDAIQKEEREKKKAFEEEISNISREMELRIAQNQLNSKSKQDDLKAVEAAIKLHKELEQTYQEIYGAEEGAIRYEENAVKLKQKQQSIVLAIRKEEEKANNLEDKQRIKEIEEEILRIKKEQAGTSTKSLSEQVALISKAIREYDKLLDNDKLLNKNLAERKKLEEKKLGLVKERYDIEKKIAQLNEDAQKKLEEARKQSLQAQLETVEYQMTQAQEKGTTGTSAYQQLKQKRDWINQALYEYEKNELKREFDERVKNASKESQAYIDYEKAYHVQLTALAQKHQLAMTKQQEETTKAERELHNDLTLTGQSNKFDTATSEIGRSSGRGRGSSTSAINTLNNTMMKLVNEGVTLKEGALQGNDGGFTWNAGEAATVLKRLGDNASAAAYALESVAQKARMVNFNRQSYGGSTNNPGNGPSDSGANPGATR